MKETEQNNNIENIPNEINNECQKHYIKESTLHLDSEFKPTENNKEEENTVTQTIVTLLKGKNEENNETLYQLNNSSKKTDDTSNNSLQKTNDVKKENNSTQTTNEGFLQKTKRWAGNVWSYINIKNYFPKAEYIEYKNANGDIVKIPKKKIPLKKKPKTEEDDEQHIVNKMVEREDKKMYSYAMDNVPFASHFF